LEKYSRYEEKAKHDNLDKQTRNNDFLAHVISFKVPADCSPPPQLEG